MRLYLVVLILSVLIGCGKDDSRTPASTSTTTTTVTPPSSGGSSEVPNEYQVYVDDFVKLIKDSTSFPISTVNFNPIVIGALAENMFGYCRVPPPPGGKNTVTINSKYVTTYRNAPVFKFVIYHELGHCLMGQVHVEGDLMQASGSLDITQAEADSLVAKFIDRIKLTYPK